VRHIACRPVFFVSLGGGSASAGRVAALVEVTLTTWVVFNLFVLGLLALDLGVFHRKAHAVSIREAAIWSVIWVGLALTFAAGLLWRAGSDTAVTFLTGYLIEKSLSVDNIFVFVVLFAALGTLAQYQHRVLFIGIISALVMRFAMILAGAALLDRFHWLLYVFGAFLVLTGIRLAMKKGHTNPLDSAPMRLVQRLIPFQREYDGQKFVTRAANTGKRVATPLLLALIAVELTDVLFALDSIPAIFAVTRDPFIVYTANVFAILGLRSLYFLLADVVDRFRYLSLGLAAVLVFVGCKMLALDFVKIPPVLSLVIVLGILAVSVVASLALPAKAPVSVPKPSGGASA